MIKDNGSGELGTVTIKACSRGAFFVDWSCRGHFEVNDPEAEPYPPMDNVRVVNDLRRHATGAGVPVSRGLGSHDAYLWGEEEQIHVVAFWVTVALASAAAVVAAATRRYVWLPSSAVAVGVVIASLAHPY